MTSQLAKQEEKALKDSTIIPTFQPTPHMLVWLDTAINAMTDNKTEIARQSGMDESSWYKWLKLDGFEDWYWAEYDKKTRRWKPMVDSIGIKYAQRGSDKHFEYLAKRVGNIKEDSGNTQATQVNINVGGNETENIEL